VAGTVRPVADERDGLLSFLDQQRYVLRLAAYGLTDEQMQQAPSASELSVGAVIKHITAVERTWMDVILRRYRPRTAEEWLAQFRIEPDETPEVLLGRYADAASDTNDVIADIADLGQDVPVPKGVPWFPADVDAWSVRWVLLHLIQETARHATPTSSGSHWMAPRRCR
jgi:uncharacterized damage-inducible protein DinB